MAQINKIKSGLLLYEDFAQSSLIWTPSPNGYENIEYDGVNGLRLIHSTKYKTITIEEPQKNYSFVCELNHIPIDAKDIGGVIIMSNDTFYAECQSYVATKPSYLVNHNQTEQQIITFVNAMLEQYSKTLVRYSVTDDTGTYPEPIDIDNGTPDTPVDFVDSMYPYIKVSKLNEIYTFWASIDKKNWIEVGNTEVVDSNRIGFFLYSYDTISQEIINNSHFYVKSMMLYDNNYVTIENIKENQVLELRNHEGLLICDTNSPNVKRVNNKIIIDTTLLEIPYKNLTLKVLQNKNIIYEYNIPELVGGDIYSYGYSIKLSINEIEINQEELFDLGVFYHNNQTIRLDIYNQELYDLENLKITITSYSVYYGGNETIGVSLYDEAEINNNFSDSVIIPLIKPTEGKSVLLKLTDKIMQDFYKKAGEYRFKINIE